MDSEHSGVCYRRVSDDPLERRRAGEDIGRAADERPQRPARFWHRLHRLLPVGLLGWFSLPRAEDSSVDHAAEQLGFGVEDEEDGLHGNAGALGE